MNNLILREGLNYDLKQLCSDKKAYEYYQKLEREIIYFNREKFKVKIFGKEYSVPRSVAAYGDIGLKYRFSGLCVYPKPWTPLLNEIRQNVEQATGEQFNFVLINRYNDGKDYIGPHRDNEKDIITNSVIASVSLGQTRNFIFSRKHFDSVKLQLKNGSLLIMKPPTNDYWYHSLPRSDAKYPRINLTFRRMKKYPF